MTSLQPLPAGTNDLAQLRARNELYVDKTAYVADMLDGYSKYCFLARPRRFGKSLLVSTLEYLFQGRVDLFRGTALECRMPRSPNWIWPAAVPVIRLNMNDWHTRDAASLNAGLLVHIDLYCDRFRLPSPASRDAAAAFSVLLTALAAAQGEIAVLIDEYDHPLLHNLDNPALPQIQALLANFYGVLKNHDARLRFVFLTGVTRFARTSVFSGLNNLRDLSHEPRFNGLLGFTEAEVQRHLTPYMAGLTDHEGCPVADAPARMREYYDGYLFAARAADAARVYNPYSALTCLNTKVLDYYWAETGIPFFLPQMLAVHDCDVRDVRHIPSRTVLGGALTAVQLAQLWKQTPSDHRPAPDWITLSLAKVMFQTGYLTLRRHQETRGYVTDFPNLEVADSFVQDVIPYTFGDRTFSFAYLADVNQAVLTRDPVALQAAGNRLLTSLTYLEHRPQERYYQSILHLALLGLQYKAHVQAEVNLHRGRPDIVVAFAREVVIMELKMDDARETAQRQADRKAYPQRYAHEGKTVHVWGITIGRAEREILDITAQRYERRGGTA